METREMRDLFPGALEMMILHCLRKEPMHGYALAQIIRSSSGDLLQIEEGSLYPALQRMLKADWVAAEWAVSGTGRRVRVYQLTGAGRKRLENQASSFDRMMEGIRKVMRPVHP